MDIEQFDLNLLENPSKNQFNLDVPVNIPLGKRVEYFFEYLINSSSNFEVITKNIQIFENSQTIGEIDFILKDINKNQFYHIEFVYKYYLYFNESSDEIENFLGPNLNDSLIKKLTKIKEKQFPIINHRKTKNLLDKIDAKNIIQKTCFLGNIYLAKNKYFNFKYVNNSCIKGFYISINEFKENIKEYSLDKYFLPHRFDWVVNPNTNKIWKSYEEILEEIEVFIDLKKSPLVFGKTKEGDYFSFFITYYETI